MVHAGYFSVLTICTVADDDVHCLTIYSVDDDDFYAEMHVVLSNLLLFDLFLFLCFTGVDQFLRIVGL